MKTARKEWEVISKTPAEIARCIGCEEAWRAGTKDVLRSLIAGGIAVATVRKWVAEERGKGKRGKKLKVDLGGKRYSDWWIVPKVATVEVGE